MKNRVNLKTLAAALLATRSFASQAGVWSGPEEITRIDYHPSGRIFIVTAWAVPNNPCGSADAGYYELDPNAPLFSEQYSLLLTAFAAGMKVVINVDGCGNFYPYARNTYVLK